MKENSWLKQIFLVHAHISYQPIKIRDVTAVFPYSHLNTAIDQWEWAYYPNYFIKNYTLR